MTSSGWLAYTSRRYVTPSSRYQAETTPLLRSSWRRYSETAAMACAGMSRWTWASIPGEPKAV